MPLALAYSSSSPSVIGRPFWIHGIVDLVGSAEGRPIRAEHRLRDPAKNHSVFIGLAIKLYAEKSNEKEVTDSSEEEDAEMRAEIPAKAPIPVFHGRNCGCARDLSA